MSIKIGKTVNGLQVAVENEGVVLVDEDLEATLDLDEALELAALLIRAVLVADKGGK